MVYLATDPDREGEAIAWHLQEALGLPDDRVRRVTVPRDHREGRQGGVQPRRPDQHGHGQRPAGPAVPRPVRRLSAQPAALEKVARHLSAGRVQSVAVRLIADREKEIQAFVSEEYWKITATLEPRRRDRPRPTGSRPRWPSGRGRSSRPRTRPTPAPSATPWPRPPTRSRASRRSRSSTRPTPRSRPARSSSRARSASGSRASGR